MTQTVTGLYDTYDSAVSAVNALEASGVPHSDISIVSNNVDNRYTKDHPTNAAADAGKGAGIGAAVGGVGGLLTGLGLLAIPGVGPVVAAGWLVATAAGAATGAVVGGAAGGLVGSLTGAGVPERDAQFYAEGVRRGGTLVTARVDDARASTAREILQRYKAGSALVFRPASDHLKLRPQPIRDRARIPLYPNHRDHPSRNQSETSRFP
jgi:hypothetical protein